LHKRHSKTFWLYLLGEPRLDSEAANARNATTRGPRLFPVSSTVN
jgi:hypothetical protein